MTNIDRCRADDGRDFVRVKIACRPKSVPDRLRPGPRIALHLFEATASAAGATGRPR